MEFNFAVIYPLAGMSGTGLCSLYLYPRHRLKWQNGSLRRKHSELMTCAFMGAVHIWNDLLQLLVESELVGEASEQGKASHAWYILLYWFCFLPGWESLFSIQTFGLLSPSCAPSTIIIFHTAVTKSLTKAPLGLTLACLWVPSR